MQCPVTALGTPVILLAVSISLDLTLTVSGRIESWLSTAFGRSRWTVSASGRTSKWGEHWVPALVLCGTILCPMSFLSTVAAGVVRLVSRRNVFVPAASFQGVHKHSEQLSVTGTVDVPIIPTNGLGVSSMGCCWPVVIIKLCAVVQLGFFQDGLDVQFFFDHDGMCFIIVAVSHLE